MAKKKKEEEIKGIDVEANVEGKKIIKSYGPMIEAVNFGERTELRKLSTADLRRIYEHDDIVGPVIDALMYSCTTAGYHFEAYKGEKIDQRHLKIVQRFFDEPNEDDTANDLLRDCFLDLLVYGTEYWEVTISSKDMIGYENALNNKKIEVDDIVFPYKLYRVNPEYIKINMSRVGKITSFSQRIKGKVTANFKPNNIIYFKLPRPGNRVYGLAPAAKTGIHEAVAANIYCAQYNGKFFKNNATPRLHIDLGNVGKTEFDNFLVYLETNIKGQPHKNLVTTSKDKENKVTVKAISLKNSEMEFSVFAKNLQRKIYGAYRMQPIIMGITEGEGKTTVDAQISIYKAQAVRPLQSIVADRVNRKVMKRMFPGIRLKFRFNPIDVLDELEQIKITEIELKACLKTINDVLGERGLPLKPYGDKPIIPFSDAGKAQLPTEPDKKEEEKDKDKDKDKEEKDEEKE